MAGYTYTKRKPTKDAKKANNYGPLKWEAGMYSNMTPAGDLGTQASEITNFTLFGQGSLKKRAGTYVVQSGENVKGIIRGINKYRQANGLDLLSTDVQGYFYVQSERTNYIKSERNIYYIAVAGILFRVFNNNAIPVPWFEYKEINNTFNETQDDFFINTEKPGEYIIQTPFLYNEEAKTLTYNPDYKHLLGNAKYFEVKEGIAYWLVGPKLLQFPVEKFWLLNEEKKIDINKKTGLVSTINTPDISDVSFNEGLLKTLFVSKSWIEMPVKNVSADLYNGAGGNLFSTNPYNRVIEFSSTLSDGAERLNFIGEINQDKLQTTIPETLSSEDYFNTWRTDIIDIELDFNLLDGNTDTPNIYSTDENGNRLYVTSTHEAISSFADNNIQDNLLKDSGHHTFYLNYSTYINIQLYEDDTFETFSDILNVSNDETNENSTEHNLYYYIADFGDEWNNNSQISMMYSELFPRDYNIKDGNVVLTLGGSTYAFSDQDGYEDKTKNLNDPSAFVNVKTPEDEDFIDVRSLYYYIYMEPITSKTYIPSYYYPTQSILTLNNSLNQTKNPIKNQSDAVEYFVDLDPEKQINQYFFPLYEPVPTNDLATNQKIRSIYGFYLTGDELGNLDNNLYTQYSFGAQLSFKTSNPRNNTSGKFDNTYEGTKLNDYYNNYKVDTSMVSEVLNIKEGYENVISFLKDLANINNIANNTGLSNTIDNLEFCHTSFNDFRIGYDYGAKEKHDFMWGHYIRGWGWNHDSSNAGYSNTGRVIFNTKGFNTTPVFVYGGKDATYVEGWDPQGEYTQGVEIYSASDNVNLLYFNPTDTQKLNTSLSINYNFKLDWNEGAGTIEYSDLINFFGEDAWNSIGTQNEQLVINYVLERSDSPVPDIGKHGYVVNIATNTEFKDKILTLKAVFENVNAGLYSLVSQPIVRLNYSLIYDNDSSSSTFGAYLIKVRFEFLVYYYTQANVISDVSFRFTGIYSDKYPIISGEAVNFIAGISAETPVAGYGDETQPDLETNKYFTWIVKRLEDITAQETIINDYIPRDKQQWQTGYQATKKTIIFSGETSYGVACAELSYDAWNSLTDTTDFNELINSGEMHYTYKTILPLSEQTTSTIDDLKLKDSNGNLKDISGFLIYKNQMMLYSGTKIYISQLNQFNYYPYTFILDLGDAVTDTQIKAIRYIQGTLAIITNKNIYVLSGSTPVDFNLSLINQDYGTISESSPSVFNNGIAFLSMQGVMKLTNTNYASADNLNITELDVPIKDLIIDLPISDKEKGVGALYNNNYILYLPDSANNKHYIYVFITYLKAWIRWESNIFKVLQMWVYNNSLFIGRKDIPEILRFDYKFNEDINVRLENNSILQNDLITYADRGNKYPRQVYKINSVLESGYLTFGLPNHTKNFKTISLFLDGTSALSNYTLDAWSNLNSILTTEKLGVLQNEDDSLSIVSTDYKVDNYFGANNTVNKVVNRFNIASFDRGSFDNLTALYENKFNLQGKGYYMKYRLEHNDYTDLNLLWYGVTLKVKKAS